MVLLAEKTKRHYLVISIAAEALSLCARAAREICRSLVFVCKGSKRNLPKALTIALLHKYGEDTNQCRGL